MCRSGSGGVHGQCRGQAALWRTVEWLFLNTQGRGLGLPDDLSVTGAMAAAQECFASDAPRKVVHSHTWLAGQEGINAMPILKLEDPMTWKELVLPSAVEDDALLSALDLPSVEKVVDTRPTAPHR